MKYIIDVPDEYAMESALYGKQLAIPFYVNANDKSFYLPTGLKIEPYTEHSQKAIDLQHAHDIENVARMNYSKGTEDAWELARRIICPSDCCEDSISAYTKEIFNKDGWEIRGIFNDLSYQKAKAKYEEWLKQKDEIRVGDEVIYNSRTKAVVLIPETKERYGTILTSEFITIAVSHDDLEKTGRHFIEVEKLVEKMGEEE